MERIRFFEGDRTQTRRTGRVLLMASLVVLGGSSILFRSIVLDVSFRGPLVLMVTIVGPLVLVSYVVRWGWTRWKLAAAGSGRCLFAHGNVFRVQRDLIPDLDEVEMRKFRYESRLLVFLDTTPPRLEAVPGLGMSAGGINFSDTTAITVLYAGNRVRSIELEDNGRTSLIEGRGKLPSWALADNGDS